MSLLKVLSPLLLTISLSAFADSPELPEKTAKTLFFEYLQETDTTYSNQVEQSSVDAQAKARLANEEAAIDTGKVFQSVVGRVSRENRFMECTETTTLYVGEVQHVNKHFNYSNRTGGFKAFDSMYSFRAINAYPAFDEKNAAFAVGTYSCKIK